MTEADRAGSARSPVAMAQQTRRRNQLNWDAAASQDRDKIIIRIAQDLETEAERIAKRRDSTVVTAHYVQQASANLTIGRSSTGLADILLALGALLLGPAIGVGSSYAIPAQAPHYVGWYVLTSILAAMVGTLLLGSGVTLKIKAR